MSGVLTFPAVTEDLLQEAVRRIVDVGNPKKIVLFGSRARGDARPNSDLDLLIRAESGEPRYARSPRYYLSLADLFPEEDILVYTPEEVQEWSGVPNAIVTAAIREGRVLFEDEE